MKTPAKLGSALLLVLTSLSGCSQAQPLSPAPDAANTTGVTQTLLPTASGAASAIVADLGNGQKTPASINFHLDLAATGRYSLKASSAGEAAKTLADLSTIKFYLIESTTGTPPTALAGSGFSYQVSGTNRTNGFVDITFTNVAANATGKSYYAAVAGFSSSTQTAANNLTNAAAPIDDATEGKYFTSTTGGSPAGALRVTPTTYAISGTSALGIPLKLLDAVSPVIESSVNLTVGDEVTGAPSGSAN